MKSSTLYLLITTTAMFIAGFAIIVDREELLPSTVAYSQEKILITSAGYFDINKPPNAVLLLVDKRDILNIKEAESIIYGQRFRHTCGYHWDISFWENPINEKRLFSINEEYCGNRLALELLQPYFNKIKENPSDFLLNIEVPATIETNELISMVVAHGFHIFIAGGKYVNYPNIDLSYKSPDIENRPIYINDGENVKKKLTMMITKIKAKCPIANVGDIRISPNGKGDIAGINIIFNYGAKLDCLNGLFDENSGYSIEKNIPNSYSAQIIVPNKFSEKTKKDLLIKFPFILEVTGTDFIP